MVQEADEPGRAIEAHAIASLPPDLALLKLENDTITSLAAAHPRDFQKIKGEIDKAEATINNLRGEQKDAALEILQASISRTNHQSQLEELLTRTNSVRNKPGYFWIKSPMNGIVLSADFEEALKNKYVKPDTPLLRIGEVDPDRPRLSEWEIELKIPQKHIGQILQAYGKVDVNGYLEVDLLLTNLPTRTFRAKVARSKVAFTAEPNRSDNNEPEPVVLARVQVDHPDIPEEYKLPKELLTTGIEVHARVRCGNHAMGYSLFYGVWEFIYEKIVFFF